MSDIKKNLSDLCEKFEKSNSILLMSHTKPDGDSIGSLLAMGLALRKLYGDKVNVACLDVIPTKFKFLNNIDIIKNNIEDLNYDLLITLDCGDKSRIDRNNDDVFDKANFVINIDHHISNTNFGDINIVDAYASSTGEIVYEIIKEINIGIDKDIATAIYVAISTDTGSFKYDNTTSRTHSIVSKLMDYEIDINSIVTNVYQSRSLQKTNLFIEAIKTIELFFDNKVAFIKISKDLLSRTKSKTEDLDGIIEFIRDIDTIEVACVLREISTDETKVGFRSKTYFDVAELAKQLKGGGHKKASGCTVYNDIYKTQDIIIEKIKNELR